MLFNPAMAEVMNQYLLETSPILVLRLDAHHAVADANAQALRMLGGDLVGRPLKELIVDFAQVLDLPAVIRQSGVVHRLMISTAAGLPENVELRFFALPEGALALGSFDFQEQLKLRGEALGLIGELNNLTRQIQQSNAELRELNQLKNQFLGMAAHDLRVPLGVIITHSEFVLDEAGASLGAEHRKFLRTCLTAATDMQRIIDHFLSVSVIESGQLRLERAPVSLREILAPLEPVVRMAAKKKITVLVAASENPRRLALDAAKVQQVLLNLLGNAVRHSVPGQRVWVSARWETRQVVFAVRDEGPGLAPKDQARLFPPPVQAGTRKTAGQRSLGLGLAIAQSVVEAHGGRIWVESTPGLGATFFFTLPAPDPADSPAPS